MMTSGRSRLTLTIALLLALATVLVYAQVGGHEFISYDDNLYVTENRMVQGGLSWSGLVWAFTTLHSANWHPLTWLSHMLDVQLFGLRPAAHHLVNVLFHAANTVLLFLVLLKMTGAQWRSAFVAALFSLHPLHVESVAWVAERKDILSGFFGLLTLCAYVRYAESPSASRYASVTVMLVLGLLSKPMLVTMPFLLLLMDYWPLGRMSGRFHLIPESGPAGLPAPLLRLLSEKIPLFALCAASGVVTVVAQRRGEAMADLSLGLGLRLSNASVGYIRYLGKTLWPGALSIFYPHPGSGIPAWQVAGSFFVLALLTALVLLRVRQSPWLSVGWFWFIGTLVPVIGLVQVGAQSIADRYTYIPLVGIFVMVSWGGHELLNNWRVRPQALWAASVLVIVVLAVLTWRQLGFWKNHETLFRHAISVTKNNCVAHNSLADYLNRKGDSGEALFHLRESLRLCPKDEVAWYNLGVWQRQNGNMPDAVSALREALRLKPGYTKAWTNLGAAYMALGSMPEATDALLAAARLAPDDATVWFNLGVVHAKAGQFAEAVEAFRKAVLIMPDHAASWHLMGMAYLALGRQREALEVVQTLQALDTKLAEDLLDQMSRRR